MEYVQRAIYKAGHRLDGMMHDRVHVSDGGETLCGKTLGEMWYITGDDKRHKKIVTCRECAKKYGV